MKIHDLKSSLEKDYDLVAFVDLADMREQHSAVYKLFKSIKQDVFNDNQRIVFYSQHKPENKFLQHIINAAELIDIGNFFILIVCPYKLETSLHSLVINIEKTKDFQQPKYVVSDSLCPSPFSNLTALPNNKIHPCCKFSGSLGNLENRSLKEEFDNEKMQKLREQMIQGEYPSECRSCWHDESTGVTSYRQYMLTKHEEELHFDWLDDVKVRSLNWSPSRLCNFKCRICSSKFSTSIAAEELKFTDDQNRKQELKDFLHQEKSKDNSLRIIQNLTELDKLKYLHILGGEPLMWTELDTCLDALIDSGQSKNIIIESNTNGSQWSESTINKMITNFKGVEFVISIDDVEERFEITRGSKWQLVENNLKKFSELQSDKFKCVLSLTVNLQNILYLESIIDLADRLNFGITWIYLEDPSFLCMDNATSATIELVKQKYTNHNNDELRKIAHRMSVSKPSDGKEFITYADMLDTRRKQNFKETHKEIYEAMSINTHI
jgi:radical SAM protein with 4Fe4S-binding SPASM domain